MKILNDFFVINNKPVQLGESFAEVEATFGQPFSKVLRDEFEIWQYTSSSSAGADYLWFKDGKSVLFSRSLLKEPTTLNELLQLAGPSSVSFEVSARPDSGSQEVLQVWEGQGVSAQALGTDGSASLIRLRLFNPEMTTQEYLKAFEPIYLSAQVPKEPVQSTKQVPPTDAGQVSNNRLPLQLSALAVGLVIVIVLVGWFFMKRRNAQSAPFPPEA